MRRRIIVVLVLITVIILGCSCSQKSGGMKDGYYTAEGAQFSEHGWKEYLTIYVSNNRILTVEYDAYNESGFVRSWDINYMRVMNRVSGNYPNQFTREYSVSLLNWQDTGEVDAISGATDSHASFILLADAAIAQAKTGVGRVVLVDLSDEGSQTEGLMP